MPDIALKVQVSYKCSLKTELKTLVDFVRNKQIKTRIS